MISCPECQKALNLFSRSDKHGYLRAFIVECDACGFNKYLRRPLTAYQSWKIGYQAGYEYGTRYASYEVYSFSMLLTILGVCLYWLFQALYTVYG